MTEEQKKLISEELKLQRFKNKVKAADMAKALGISRETYRKLETDPTNIRLNQGIIISSILNWSFYDFILLIKIAECKTKEGK